MTHASVSEVRTHTGLRDFVALTKPRIISLLLVTTIAPMYVAGTPSWIRVVLVALGGYLMAGGANAVNMYLDRDIDETMARTRLRPIPSGRMTPAAVLAFGVALAAAATWLLAAFVNVLSAALALGVSMHTSLSTRAGSSARRRRTSSSVERLVRSHRS